MRVRPAPIRRAAEPRGPPGNRLTPRQVAGSDRSSPWNAAPAVSTSGTPRRATPRGRTNGTALASSTKPPCASKHWRVAISGSCARRTPQRKAVGPVSRTGVAILVAMFMDSALLAAGDEAMAEQSGRVLLQVPLWIARPQRAELMAVEARARAHHCVVDADVVAADHPEEPARLDHQLAASWLARHHHRGRSGDLGEQARELGIGKMMQEQVGGNDVCGLPLRQKIEHVGRGRLGAPAERGEARAGRLAHNVLLVEENNADARPARREATRDRKHELAVAR